MVTGVKSVPAYPDGMELPGVLVHLASGEITLQRKRVAKAKCPFENLKKTGNWPPIIVRPEGSPASVTHSAKATRVKKTTAGKAESWRTVLLQNKFPLLTHGSTPFVHGRICPAEEVRGPFHAMAGVGHHDLIITRDHHKNFAHLSLNQAVEVLELMQERFRALSKDPCMKYSMALANWGPTAGASIYHPHYQIVTLPVTPPDISRSLRGSREHYERTERCIHCEMLKFDLGDSGLVVARARGALAIAPFVSRRPFEVRVFPEKHRPFFEKTPASEIRGVAQVLQATLRKMERALGDPDYNFYLHTAPLKDQKKFAHYHWHIEVIPVLFNFGIPAGFEFGTGEYVNVVAPETAAEVLRRGRFTESQGPVLPLAPPSLPSSLKLRRSRKLRSGQARGRKRG